MLRPVASMWDIVLPPTATLTMVVAIVMTIMTAVIVTVIPMVVIAVTVTAIGASLPLVVGCTCRRVLWYGELHTERVSCVAVQVGSEIERILQMYNLMSERFFTHASPPRTCKCHVRVFVLLPASPTNKLPPVTQG